MKDPRFIACDGQQVTFRYGNHRELDDSGKPQQQELTLSVTEFLHRWSEHVPVPGVHRVRAWGRYASTQRPKLAQGREQLPEEAPRATPRVVETAPPRDHDRPWERCPVGQQPMVVTQVLPRAGAPPRVESWPEAA
ncbi:MAG: transposase [Deltaproteobacteria bacterium]|nr:transposase [Deltaproteobacteria bacterium]